MAYAKITSIFTVSPTSDYATNLTPSNDYDSVISAAATKWETRTVSAATTGTTVELGTYSSVLGFRVKNTDSTNYVAVTWTNNGTANSQRLIAGQEMFVPGCTVANDIVLTANTAACVCEVQIVGT